MSRRQAGGLKSKQKYPQEVKPSPAYSNQGHNAKEGFSLKTKLKPKNYSQELYIESLKENTITICNGPAGSGKTYIVTAVALEKLMNNEIDRIVLTRPVVEAGENLGFLPGDFKEKLHPYLLPLIDAIEDHVGPAMAQKLQDSGKIEVAPLAFMRGRTFNNAFVILDEAQNTTKEQMRMFMTRIGYNTQMCINGDHSQSDLGLKYEEHGLQWAVRKLRGNVSDIVVCEFSTKDIVRNPLITKILNYLDSPEPRKEHHESTTEIKIHGRNNHVALLQQGR